jgi:hypothetical protein
MSFIGAPTSSIQPARAGFFMRHFFICHLWGSQTLSDDEIIKEAHEAFQLAAEAEGENRREALDDLRFARLGEQWPAQIRRERELDGRPWVHVSFDPRRRRQVLTRRVEGGYGLGLPDEREPAASSRT